MDTDEQATCDSAQSTGLIQIGDNPAAYELLDDTPVLVHSGLYIGTYRAEQNRRKLMQSRITDVLQVRTQRGTFMITRRAIRGQ
jgi:hypothetical protein